MGQHKTGQICRWPRDKSAEYVRWSDCNESVQLRALTQGNPTNMQTDDARPEQLEPTAGMPHCTNHAWRHLQIKWNVLPVSAKCIAAPTNSCESVWCCVYLLAYLTVGMQRRFIHECLGGQQAHCSLRNNWNKDESYCKFILAVCIALFVLSVSFFKSSTCQDWLGLVKWDVSEGNEKDLQKIAIMWCWLAIKSFAHATKQSFSFSLVSLVLLSAWQKQCSTPNKIGKVDTKNGNKTRLNK